MLDFEAKENCRAEFQEDDFLYLSGQKELYYSETKHSIKVFISFCIVFLLCGGVIGTTAAIYIFKAYLYGHSETAAQSASVVSSVMNAISIQVWGFIYNLVAKSLNDFENHKYVIFLFMLL